MPTKGSSMSIVQAEALLVIPTTDKNALPSDLHDWNGYSGSFMVKDPETHQDVTIICFEKAQALKEIQASNSYRQLASRFSNIKQFVAGSGSSR